MLRIRKQKMNDEDEQTKYICIKISKQKIPKNDWNSIAAITIDWKTNFSFCCALLIAFDSSSCFFLPNNNAMCRMQTITDYYNCNYNYNYIQLEA